MIATALLPRVMAMDRRGGDVPPSRNASWR